jgi:hypothetical protein
MIKLIFCREDNMYVYTYKGHAEHTVDLRTFSYRISKHLEGFLHISVFFCRLMLRVNQLEFLIYLYESDRI